MIPNANASALRSVCSGFVLLLATMGLFLLGALGVGAALAYEVDLVLWAALAGIAAGGFVIAIGLMIYSAAFSPLTPEGEEEAARWKSFCQISQTRQ